MVSNTQESVGAAFANLPASGVALLTTYRRDGRAVGTAVGIRKHADHVLFTTWSTTGKVKRLQANPEVTLAPATRRGTPTGPTVAGIARRLTGAEEQAALAAMRSGLEGRFWLFLYRLRRLQPVIYEIRPRVEAPPP